MSSARTILKHLKKYDEYLNKFQQAHRSIYFEELIGHAFSHILYLPFYTSDNDNPNDSFRVIWQGSLNPPSNSPPGPDLIAYCYDFNFLIEATLKTGANQWTQEFASSARHCDDFISQRGVKPNKVYILLATPKLHQDTYRSIHQHPRQEFYFIPIEVSNLAKILETSILAFTTRHLDLRKLFHKIQRSVKTSSSLRDYRKSVSELVTEWQKDVFRQEKSVFVGVKSYEAMKKINRTHVGASEILQRLQKHPFIRQYLKIIGGKLTSDIIEDSLIQQSLASRLSLTYDGEPIFGPIPYEDFKGRGLRLIEEVENKK